jgi:hypothetical protein
MSAKKAKPAANYGIQANQVIGNTIVTGKNPRATTTILVTEERQQLYAAVREIQEALNSLSLQPQAKAVIKEEVDELHAATSATDVKADRVSSILKNLSGKLKMVGVVVSEVVALSEPLQKLAGMLHIPLHMLGI